MALASPSNMKDLGEGTHNVIVTDPVCVSVDASGNITMVKWTTDIIQIVIPD